MALDPYASCPCGSGKKFKWCCQPIHVQIDRAFQQFSDGQHEAALRMMDEVIAAHAGNPEAWGRKAQLLYQEGKVEDAENALQKAFEINADYPFGHLLRGMFRHSESEFAGAVLCFRKAADVYDPEARDALAQVHAMIADCELKLNRPVAARAALLIAQRCQPASEELRQNFEMAFGAESRLPAAARREYTFLSPPATAAGQRRAAWDSALASAGTRLTQAAQAFEKLTVEDDSDPSAWYNLGLVRAWLGDNRAALAALDRFVALEPDEKRAGAAWALGEVLRTGQGMEEQADYVEHSATFQIRDPQPIVALLQQWEQERRLVALQTGQEEQVFAALLMEKPAMLMAGTPAPRYAHLAANVMLFEGLFRVWHINKETVAKVRQEVQERAGPGLSPPHERTSRAGFGDILAEALVFPLGQIDRAEAEQRVREQAERYFEETWIHRPLRSLNLIPPIDAAGDRTLRKKLIGVVQFLEECASGILASYDFARLRRKLGLESAAPSTAAGTAAPTPTLDIGAMGAAELAALKPDQLGDEQLEQAYQSAVKLDAHELAGRFVRDLVGRAPRADRLDRFPFYSYLIQRALQDGNTDQALDYVNDGERSDCEHNEGRRRNDYELRRGQVHTRRGETDLAQEVFDRLIERAPANAQYRGKAAEAMLSLRQPARALRFAEQGLATAREQNDRDSEQYLMELAGAAKKQGG